MTWVVSGVTAGTAALGAFQADEQRKAQIAANRQQAEMAAAQTQYSPWTGMATGQANLQAVTGNPLAGALQGGLQGAMFAKSLKPSQDAQAGISAGGPSDEDLRRRLGMIS